MSQLQNPATAAVARYPKRKRAQVDYVEELEGDEYDIESETQDAMESAPSKVHGMRKSQLPSLTGT